MFAHRRSTCQRQWNAPHRPALWPCSWTFSTGYQPIAWLPAFYVFNRTSSQPFSLPHAFSGIVFFDGSKCFSFISEYKKKEYFLGSVSHRSDIRRVIKSFWTLFQNRLFHIFLIKCVSWNRYEDLHFVYAARKPDAYIRLINANGFLCTNIEKS